MSLHNVDPNRFATDVEAATINARARVERANVALATERLDLAQESHRAARERFAAAEAAYKLTTAALEDAAEYETLARQQLVYSVEQLASKTALLHPIRKTPLELLGAIFSYCLVDLPIRGDTLPVNEKDIRVRQRQPFQLAAVCRRWRQASLSCPAAWNTLEILLAAGSGNEKAWEAYVGCILSRSSSTPLDIRVTRTAEANNGKDTNLIFPLQQAMTRCSSLLVHAYSIQDESDALVPLLTTPSPLLHTFHFVVEPRGGGAFLRELAWLPDAPKLRFIHALCPIHGGLPVFPILEAAVLDFPVVAPTLGRDDLSEVARVAPKLNRLTLMQCRAVERPEPITLSLAKLCILHTDADGFSTEFLRHCRLPRVDWVKLCGGLDGSSERIDILAVILPNSPVLTSLSLSMVAVDDFAALCRVLQLASALTALTVRKSTFTHPSLRLFTNTLGRPRTDDGVWTCPALKSLFLGTCTFSTDCALDDVVQLVARKRQAADAPVEEGKSSPVCLRTVQLPDDTDTAITAQIKTLLSRS